MADLWDRHTAAEFETASLEATMDTDALPATDAEATRKVLDPAAEPSNRLIERHGTG
ncbi:MAG TPA: hypothetical protein VK837_01930 [Longimicrobiales bacterium]|nr:hypothetical protein [Longimicrobiales bacterium]